MKITVTIKYSPVASGYLVGIEMPKTKNQVLINLLIFSMGVFISAHDFDKFDIKFKRVFKFDKLKEFDFKEDLDEMDIYNLSKEIIEFILNYE